MALKAHLVSEGCVANRFEMLTYCVYAPLSKRFDALPSNTTWAFKAIFNSSKHVADLPDKFRYIVPF